jgi:hypothetical protein
MEDLKGRVVRSGFARLCGQAANFALRLGSLGSCCGDNRLTGYQYGLYVADDGMDPGDAAPSLFGHGPRRTRSDKRKEGGSGENDCLYSSRLPTTTMLHCGARDANSRRAVSAPALGHCQNLLRISN